MNLVHWFHHLFDPHCTLCLEEKRCESCETLHLLLDEERSEKRKLIEQIIELTKPTPPIQEKTIENKQPINSHMSWKVKRQILEDEDRAKARIIKEQSIKPMTIEELEKKLEINNAGTIEEVS